MKRKTTFDFEKGEVFLIDKPIGWTSFDVVKKIRNQLGIKKVGHAGTLDPLATGLLLMCAGKATKKINDYQALDKVYTGVLALGKTTPSIDLETAFDHEADYTHIPREVIERAAQAQQGDIMQVPPVYSAVKVDGQRAYKAARKNEEIKLKPRAVHVTRFEIKHVDLPQVTFEIQCSKGTYVRSMVRDLGAALGCGAYLAELRRTAIGHFDVAHAQTPEDFISAHLVSSESMEQRGSDV